MSPSKQYIAATSAIKRRLVGEREWKVGINEVLESERADLLNLKRLSDKYPADAETQRIIGQLYGEKAERMIKLNELINYKERVNGDEQKSE